MESVEFRDSMQDISLKLKEFIENEARSCSMEPGLVTPEYVYRMWGGQVPLNEIEEALKSLEFSVKSVESVGEV